jgi:hypothetical protein
MKIILTAALAAVIIIAIFLFFSLEKHGTAIPTFAKDTDGTDSNDIIKNMQNGHELVILKVDPYGYVELSGWKSRGLLKKAAATAEWKTYKDLGAGNIYLGYSFGGNYTEIGPFSESEEFTKTIIEIPVGMFADLSKLKVRFRGEDTDFAADAIAEVGIKLETTSYGV